MEQLKVATNDLPSVAKKKIAAATASMSSTEAFPTTVIALQLEVATTAVVSVPSWKVGGGGECWNSGLDGWLEAVAATSEAAWLRETLPMTSRVLDPYENPVT
jgi:hypothetical protein